jgi:hypothetical protein
MALKGKRFQDVDEVKQNATEELRRVSKNTSTGVFKNGRNVEEHVWTQKEHTLKEIECK